MQNMQHNMQNNMQNMQNNMQNMQLFQICTLWSPICRICKMICKICKICKSKNLYAKYALPSLLMTGTYWYILVRTGIYFQNTHLDSCHIRYRMSHTISYVWTYDIVCPVLDVVYHIVCTISYIRYCIVGHTISYVRHRMFL